MTARQARGLLIIATIVALELLVVVFQLQRTNRELYDLAVTAAGIERTVDTPKPER